MPRNFWKKRAAFTVMEMLVVLTVFSMVAIVVIDIFFTITKAYKSLVATQAVQRDIRFTVQTIVKDIQQGVIDYDYYNSHSLALKNNSTGEVVAVNTLALIDANGLPVRYKTGTSTKELPTIMVCRGTCTSWEQLLSENIQAPLLNFYIVPETNPFAVTGTVPNKQPRVTMAVTGQAVSDSIELQQTTFFIQTTVATRTYKR